MVDAADSKSATARCGGSSPFSGIGNLTISYYLTKIIVSNRETVSDSTLRNSLYTPAARRGF